MSDPAAPAKIAFCITTLEPGGAERQLVELVTRLARDRFQPSGTQQSRFQPSVVVLAPPPQPPTDELVRRLAAESIEVQFLGGRSVWQTPQVYSHLARSLKQMRPDLVQCFLAHANMLGALAARRLNVPVVAGIRVAELRRNGHIMAQRWTQRWIDRYVCVSEDVESFAKNRMRLPAAKLLVICNGVDVAKFAAAEPIPLSELGLSIQRRILLFVGRLEHDKRPEYLIDCMTVLADKLPNHDLVLAGRGPLEASLRTLAVRRGIADRVHFVGWRSDVPRLLAAADMLLLTSSSEGMPNVVLEAMAAARPVVATEVHGVRELLGNDPQQVVPAHEPSAIYEAVERFARDSFLAAAVGLRNRERALAGFSLDAMAADYAALYGSLLAPTRSKNLPENR